MSNNSFADYIHGLESFELLVILKYQNEELSPSQKQTVDQEILRRKIDFNRYDQLQQEFKRKYKDGIHCPRCYSHRVQLDGDNDVKDFRSFYFTYLLQPWKLKLKYTCQLCTKKFKRWIQLKQIVKLLLEY